MAFNEEGNEINLSDEIHPEVRDALCVRRIDLVVPSATGSAEIDIHVHEEPENAPATVFGSPISPSIRHPSNQAQLTPELDETILTQDVVPFLLNENPATPHASASEQDDCDDLSFGEDPDLDLSIEAKTYDSTDAVPTFFTSADIPLTHLDLSSRADKFGAAGGQLKRDLERPPDSVSMSSSSVHEAVTTVLAPSAKYTSSPRHMDKKRDSKSVDNAGSPRTAPCSGRGKEQKQTLPKKKMAAESECNPLDNQNDYDRSGRTNFQRETPHR